MSTLTIERMQDLTQPQTSATNFTSDFQDAMEFLGEQYGIYGALSQSGPSTPSELAGFIGLPKSTVQMWLNTQADGGYIHYSRPADRYCLWCAIKKDR